MCYLTTFHEFYAKLISGKHITRIAERKKTFECIDEYMNKKLRITK